MFPFLALEVDDTDGQFSIKVKEKNEQDLPQGELLVQVAYSSLNYKDALACIQGGKIVKSYPFTPGIDLCGTVISSASKLFKEGDSIVATGFGLGVSHPGGFSQLARIPADWAVPLPPNLSFTEAMALGTAGLTSALAIQRLEHNGLQPDQGPVIVTGATGGVGSLSVSMLAVRQYKVTAATGKPSEHDFLRKLGAEQIIQRKELIPDKLAPLEHQHWAGAIDTVGGLTLAYLLSSLRYGGSVASCGLVGGTQVNTSVIPFILRGINLLGIDSVWCPLKLRQTLWEHMSGELKPTFLHSIFREISLLDVPEYVSQILQGNTRGRVIVKLW